jgi:hypothetical protein
MKWFGVKIQRLVYVHSDVNFSQNIFVKIHRIVYTQKLNTHFRRINIKTGPFWKKELANQDVNACVIIRNLFGYWPQSTAQDF